MRFRNLGKTLLTTTQLLLMCNAAEAQSPPECDNRGVSAHSFGPPVTPADSGRMYSYVLSRDGREFYFFKRVGTGEDYRIFRSLRTASGWSAPAQLALGGDYSDLYPSLSADGRRLVFSSYRPVPGDTSTDRNAHIWMSTRNPEGWSNPVFVRASQLGHYHSGLRQDTLGNLHYGVTTPDWRTKRNVMLEWMGDAFAATPTEVATSPAHEYWRAQSGDSIYVWGVLEGPANIALVQVSRVEERRRLPAVYFLTVRDADGWTPLVPAGVLGSDAPNFAWFSADGCWVHYTRNYTEFMRAPIHALRAASPRREGSE